MNMQPDVKPPASHPNDNSTQSRLHILIRGRLSRPWTEEDASSRGMRSFIYPGVTFEKSSGSCVGAEPSSGL